MKILLALCLCLLMQIPEPILPRISTSVTIAAWSDFDGHYELPSLSDQLPEDYSPHQDWIEYEEEP